MAPSKSTFAITALFAGIFACGLVAPAADAATESVVYSFQNNGKDGLFPHAQLTSVNGTLYGTTWNGGTGPCSGGCGAIFSFNPATGAETTLYSFRGTGGYPKYTSNPESLLAARNSLFGTTLYGGRRGAGMLFSLDLQSSTFRQRYYFCDLYNCLDGRYPNSGLTDLENTLYGTTSVTGSGGDAGTLFSFDPKTNTHTIVYTFCSVANCTDGYGPNAGLLSVNGMLYGTTGGGGICSTCGTIYSFDPNSGVEAVVYSFCAQTCEDGFEPASNLINSGRTLYGTTVYGGKSGQGTVFSFRLPDGRENVLHSFAGGTTDGQNPDTGVADLNGVLYGTTASGPNGAYCPSQCGAVYSVDPKTHSENIVYSFCSQPDCADGAVLTAGLVNVNGTLYGVTAYGGSGACTNYEEPNGCGTIFAITP
ncbi:MAG TPA: choice-of-anchor tandem repeat GloVer-containing protein [Rhizomicrobium sp.]|nr:choice-of-anchor tandem repeat GloVer-containing protein [Rhizomicrobium sp.]